MILKQIWNKRHSNIWIFLELVLVTFFMWGVIDPVYVLLSNQAIDQGYDVENVFLLDVGKYSSDHFRYQSTYDVDSVKLDFFTRIYDMVEQYPGVESAVMIPGYNYPYSPSYNGWQLCNDSIMCHFLNLKFYDKGDYFKVFRIYDAQTNQFPEKHTMQSGSVYLTKNDAEELFPGVNPVGKEVETGDRTQTYTVAGIISRYKYRSAEQPGPVSFTVQPYNYSAVVYSPQICFRIRDEVSKQLFTERFKQELAPLMSLGNFYFQELRDFEQIRSDSEYLFGVTNKIRLQTGLALFFLICTFLGIAGTFWLRCDARKNEIGLRMSLGSTRKNILKEFLFESILITTASWITGLFFVLQRVYLTGFAFQRQSVSLEYIQNRPVPHFLIVSFIVYALLLLITLAGTWIPAYRASKTEPANALRDE